MNILNVKSKLVQLPSDESTTRRGAFLVLSAFCLTGCLAFVSLAVDIAFLNLTKQQMQNGVDSAALAAAQEITAAVNTAPPRGLLMSLSMHATRRAWSLQMSQN